MKIKANAKINFSLGICGKRQDGYHLIDTVMHSVGLFDEIEIEKACDIKIFCDNETIKPQDNIAYKAALLFFETVNVFGGAKIKIFKNIPTSAGLGGGSADAAAVLCGLNKLYKTNLSEEELCKMAVKLGADVPFFIKGGCQRAEGIGEILTPCTPLKSGYLLLAKADKKPSTAQMYSLLDAKETVLPKTEKVINAIKENDLDLLSKYLYNAFETVWQESSLKEKLLSFSPISVSLTGSGPTFFALFDQKSKAQAVCDKLIKEGIECFVTNPQESAIIFE